VIARPSYKTNMTHQKTEKRRSYTVSLDPWLAEEFKKRGNGNRSYGILLVYLLLQGRKERIHKGQDKRRNTLLARRLARKKKGTL
jgi:hypothetical protein